MEVHPQRGSVISLIDLDQAREAHFVRRVLEKAIMGEACTFFPEAPLIDLRANTEMQRRCNGEKNHHRMLELDNAFHEIIYRGCNKSRTWLQLKKTHTTWTGSGCCIFQVIFRGMNSSMNTIN